MQESIVKAYMYIFQLDKGGLSVLLQACLDIHSKTTINHAILRFQMFFGVFFPIIILKERIGSEKDGSSPTHKNIFGMNYDEGGCGALSPLTFFYSTPRVKLFTHSVSRKFYFQT